jgi:hypothetical protein
VDPTEEGPANAPRTPGEEKWALYADALPEKHRDYYLRQFKRIDAGKTLGLSWNWAALLFTFNWLRYRRMRGYSWAYLFVSTPVLLFLLWLTGADRCADEVIRIVLPNVLLGLLIAGYVLPPLFANRLYFRFVRKQIASARGRRIHSSLGEFWEPSIVMFVVVVLALWAASAHQGYEMRARVNEVVFAGAAYRTAVTEFFWNKERFPLNLEEIGGYSGPHRCVKGITLEKDGSLRVVAGFPPLDGQSILFTPTVRGREVSWTCTGGDIPGKYRPSNCR